MSSILFKTTTIANLLTLSTFPCYTSSHISKPIILPLTFQSFVLLS